MKKIKVEQVKWNMANCITLARIIVDNMDLENLQAIAYTKIYDELSKDPESFGLELAANGITTKEILEDEKRKIST